MDGTGLRSCSVADFDVSIVKPLLCSQRDSFLFFVNGVLS
jgi:hypothetical protein